jgi:hypothetical protein
MRQRNIFKILAVTVGLLSVGCSQPLPPVDPVTTGEWVIEGTDDYGLISHSPHFQLFVKFEKGHDDNGLIYFGTLSSRSTRSDLTCTFGKKNSEAFYFLGCSGGVTTIAGQGQFANERYEGTYLPFSGRATPQSISMSRE